jgi:hypothetical protein
MLLWLLDGGPRKFYIYNQSVENALEQVEDTASLAVDFVDEKPSGLSCAVQRSQGGGKSRELCDMMPLS